jgi:hypothetical protein
VVVQSFVYRIENDRGSWSGQGTALVHAGGELTLDQVTNLDTVLLTGEGGYAGLGAYLLVDWTEDPPAVEGAIFGGEMPPHPRLPR